MLPMIEILMGDPMRARTTLMPISTSTKTAN